MNILNVIRKIFYFFNLESELENQDAVYEEIKKGVVFKGTNLWILMFAIIIASIGLNVNSTAVIIGAMLISPLMGPINGMGYSIATYDLVLFKKSIKNFSFAIFASLIASTIYFTLTPISTAHSELLARTSPTIYDVLIALFGGMAGIVAISSKQKGNVITGVAIATALMPPLCTAGYGLATGQYYYFFGALYLFTINTIFIAIASVWISQLLNFPIRSQIEIHRKKRIIRITNLLIVIVLLPSIYFGYLLVKQEKFVQLADQYILNVSNFEGNYLLKHTVDSKQRKIVLVYAGAALDEKQKEAIIKKSLDFKIQDAEIKVEQGLAFNSTDDRFSELFNLKSMVIDLRDSLLQKNIRIDSMLKQQRFGAVLFNEIQPFYPQIVAFSYFESVVYPNTSLSPLPTSFVIISHKNELSASDKIKINNWVSQRLNKTEVKVLFDLKRHSN